MDYLYILREALVWIITIFWLYQLLVSLCSLVKIKDKPLKVKKDHRFMAIIPAHNEEAVVGNLIESLKKQNYNKDLYDIYVIADNCTDNTAKVAKEAGAIVYKRFDETKKTKGYALNWFLQQKIEENLEDKDFLEKVLYEFRYYCMIPITKNEVIGKEPELQESIEKVMNIIIDNCIDKEIITNFSNSTSICYAILKYIFITKIIDLKEIQIKINKIKEIQYVNEVQSQIAVSIYDEKEAESIYNETVYNLKSLNVKLNKKIPLFLK